METKITFEEYLRKENLSENTITSYLWTVNYFNANYDVVSKENLLSYKGYLMEFFKPKTVNLRIQAINKYLEYLEEQHLQLKAVKVQQKNFLENVISNADYNFLKKQLKKDNNMEWYFVVWYLAATGARVSELIQIKIEHIEIGYFDLYTKGGKLRRLYIPQKLKIETLEWLEESHRSSGYLFLNRYGERITTRGISQQLKNYAEKYGLDKKVVYPHSFRHRYAKNFLEKYVGNDFDDYVVIISSPIHEIDRTYCQPFMGDVVEDNMFWLNLSQEELEDLTIRQLQAGEGGMFSCDCHPDGDRANGYWDPDCFQYGEVLGGLTFHMTKAERLLTRDSTMNHCMMFCGVNLDENGKADRWKIENSWGAASGQKGYFIGSEKWFKANVYQVTVRKSLLSDAQRALLDQEPLPMKLWDPLA